MYSPGIDRMIFVMGMVGAAIVGTCAGIVTLAAMDREPARDNIMGVPDRTTFRPGEMFTGHWVMLYVRASDSDAIRWVTCESDPQWVEYLPSEGVRPVILPQSVLPKRVTIQMSPFQVPDPPRALPGQPTRCYYHLRNEFKNNWLQRLMPSVFAVIVDFPVVEFTVLPKEETD